MPFLAGDVGATKTSLAVIAAERGPRAPLAEATLLSAHYASLHELIRAFLGRVDVPIERASLGVAGPVVDGQAEITNLSWHIDERQLQQVLGLASMRLLNDLQSIAYAVPFLQPTDLYTLKEGQAVPRAAIAVVAPGTGLGEAFLTWDGERYRAHPSEGGHTDFAPRTPLQMDMLRFLQQRLDHVSYERVCSGIGLPNVYAFLRDSGRQEPDWLAARLAQAVDPTPVIASAALDVEHPCALCRETLDIFGAVLGAEAGNLALKVLATGGVYLGGGIPPRILPALEQSTFVQAFCDKGRFADLMARIPVHVILNDRAALLGAACHVLGW